MNQLRGLTAAEMRTDGGMAKIAGANGFCG
jgi:hypothetical protein